MTSKNSKLQKEHLSNRKKEQSYQASTWNLNSKIETKEITKKHKTKHTKQKKWKVE